MANVFTWWCTKWKATFSAAYHFCCPNTTQLPLPEVVLPLLPKLIQANSTASVILQERMNELGPIAVVRVRLSRTLCAVLPRSKDVGLSRMSGWITGRLFSNTRTFLIPCSQMHFCSALIWLIAKCSVNTFDWWFLSIPPSVWNHGYWNPAHLTAKLSRST